MDPQQIPAEPTYYSQDSQEEKPSFGSKLKNNLVELIEFIAILAAIFVVIRFFIAEPHRVSGNSMVPNFHDGDYLITNKLISEKLPIKLGQLQRGEVIILENPRNADQVFIKRIVALPGETIMVSRGKVFINNEKLSEPYLPVNTVTTGGSFLNEGEQVVIPEGQYFVIGDNRGGSSDSREWGPVRVELIIGQAFLRYWPPQKMTLLKINQPSL